MRPILQAGLDPHTLRFVADEMIKEATDNEAFAIVARQDVDDTGRVFQYAEDAARSFDGTAYDYRCIARRYRKLATRVENQRRK